MPLCAGINLCIEACLERPFPSNQGSPRQASTEGTKFLFVAYSCHLESAFFSSLISFSVSSNFRSTFGSPFIAARVVHG
jgi:hypothetical protein